MIDLAQRLEVATAAAADFRRTTLMKIELVLEDHTQSLAKFMCDVWARVDAAEELLGKVAACSRGDPNRKRPEGCKTRGRWQTVNVPTSVMKEIDALLASAKARSE